MSSPPRHQITRPIPQQYDPTAGSNAPLAALISALSSVAQASSVQPAPIGQGTNDAHFTARLCSALSLQPDSLLSNIQRSKAAQNASATSPAPGGHRVSQAAQEGSKGPTLLFKQQHLGLKDTAEDGAAEHSSAVACNSREDLKQKMPAIKADIRTEQPDQEQDTSSNDNNTTSSLRMDKLKQEPLTEEAKKKRRQEINRESARRVRKRKSVEHAQLQQQVQALQAAAGSAAADQAVIVRYATELTRERDGLLQRAAELETKWITAECRNVVLRQRIAEISGVSLQEVPPETGQLMAQSGSAQQGSQA